MTSLSSKKRDRDTATTDEELPVQKKPAKVSNALREINHYLDVLFKLPPLSSDEYVSSGESPSTGNVHRRPCNADGDDYLSFYQSPHGCQREGGSCTGTHCLCTEPIERLCYIRTAQKHHGKIWEFQVGSCCVQRVKGLAKNKVCTRCQKELSPSYPFKYKNVCKECREEIQFRYALDVETITGEQTVDSAIEIKIDERLLMTENIDMKLRPETVTREQFIQQCRDEKIFREEGIDMTLRPRDVPRDIYLQKERIDRFEKEKRRLLHEEGIDVSENESLSHKEFVERERTRVARLLKEENIDVRHRCIGATTQQYVDLCRSYKKFGITSAPAPHSRFTDADSILDEHISENFTFVFDGHDFLDAPVVYNDSWYISNEKAYKYWLLTEYRAGTWRMFRGQFVVGKDEPMCEDEKTAVYSRDENVQLVTLTTGLGKQQFEEETTYYYAYTNVEDVLLNVPFSEKDRAKELGARWSPEKKKWRYQSGSKVNPLLFVEFDVVTL